MNPPRNGEGDHSAERNGGGGFPPAPQPVKKHALRKATVYVARKLRREMSPAEVVLWQQLRQRPLGFKFRRQHPVGPYVADFYCASAKLIVEVDGEAHNLGTNPQRDERRDKRLRELDFTIVRVPAADIARSSNAVADSLTRYAAQLPLHHPPSPSATTDGPPPRAGEERSPPSQELP